MCQNAQKKVGSVETEPQNSAEGQEDHEQTASNKNSQLAAFIREDAQATQGDAEFLGRFDSDDSNDDFMALSIVKVVSNLLYEKDNNNISKCIDVVVRSANCFIKLTVDTGSPSSFINQRTANKLLNNKTTNSTFCPVKEM